MSGFSGPRCGSLRASDAGGDVELHGWVGRRRDHGGLIFVDLRDRWGAVQVVFNPTTAPDAHEVASGLRPEYVVRVRGAVQRRPEGSENPHLPTGEVEVHACEVEVLNASKPTPWPLDGEEPEEAVRLKYRYLDLRRPRMQHILQVRHRVNHLTHAYFDEEDVLEIIEGWIGKLWKEILGVDLPRPWPRMPMGEALLRYGTDKPDLRYELEIADLGEALAGTQARVFRSALDGGGVVRGLAVPGGRDMTRRELDELVTIARGAGGAGLAWLPGGPLDKFLTPGELEAVLGATGAGPSDLVLVAADRRRRAGKIMGLIRTEIARRRALVREGEWRFLGVTPMFLFEDADDGNLTDG